MFVPFRSLYFFRRCTEACFGAGRLPNDGTCCLRTLGQLPCNFNASGRLCQYVLLAFALHPLYSARAFSSHPRPLTLSSTVWNGTNAYYGSREFPHRARLISADGLFPAYRPLSRIAGLVTVALTAIWPHYKNLPNTLPESADITTAGFASL